MENSYTVSPKSSLSHLTRGLTCTYSKLTGKILSFWIGGVAAYGRWSLKRGGFTWRFDSVFLIQNSVSLLYDCTYTTGTLHYTLQIRVYNSLNLLDFAMILLLHVPDPFLQHHTLTPILRQMVTAKINHYQEITEETT